LFPDKTFLSGNTGTSSHEAVFYSPHREIDSRGVAYSWAEIESIKDRSRLVAPTVCPQKIRGCMAIKRARGGNAGEVSDQVVAAWATPTASVLEEEPLDMTLYLGTQNSVTATELDHSDG
jgi:hypothetical protein